VRWYRRGAEQGDIGSQAQLGECYRTGRGVAQDSREALRWFEAALDQGFEEVAEVVASLRAEVGKRGEQ
jgi:TPR repeat protein